MCLENISSVIASNLPYSVNMTATSNADFGQKTEAHEIAAAYASYINNKTILITGANKDGVGYGTAEAFATQSPARLILAGRSAQRIQEVIDILHPQHPEIDFRILELDLSSQESTRKAASTVLDWKDVNKIDLIINNAGVMNLPTRELSPEGVEMHLNTNHLGHFTLTNLIMPKLIECAKTAPKGSVRIINVSSSGTFVTGLRVSDLNFSKKWSELPEKEHPNGGMLSGAGLSDSQDQVYIPIVAYAHSKTANVLFSVELTKKLYNKYGILSLAINPGEVRSQLARHTDPEWLKQTVAKREAAGIHYWKSLQQGASTTLVAALDPSLKEPESDGFGFFLSDCQIQKTLPHSVDEGDAKALWDYSEKAIGEHFDW